MAGACAINFNPDEYTVTPLFSRGFCAAVLAMFISGYAGIYVEGLLKNDLNLPRCFSAEYPVTLLGLNIQMSAYSALLALLQVAMFDRRTSVLHGFNKFTWLLVFLSAVGGLMTAVVVKYTDSLVKVRKATQFKCCSLVRRSH